MRSRKRQAARVLGLMVLCAHLLMCFGWGAGFSFAQPSEMDAGQHSDITFDIVQAEQPADYAVKSNSSPYRRLNSPLTLKQTYHFLSFALFLFLLAIIASFVVYPIQNCSISTRIKSWHLLRAPPKTK